MGPKTESSLDQQELKSDHDLLACKRVCFWFYAVLKVFQFFNGDSSQIHGSWTIFNQYLTSPLPWLWQASGSAILIILSAKGESHYHQF